MTEMGDYRPPVSIVYFSRLESPAAVHSTRKGPLDTGDTKVRCATGTDIKLGYIPHRQNALRRSAKRFRIRRKTLSVGSGR